jgi:hypothetical protein
LVLLKEQSVAERRSSGRNRTLWGNDFSTFVIETDFFLWAFGFALLLLLITPTVWHLYTGWRYRRDAILAAFSDEAIKTYFESFHSNYQTAKGTSPSDRLKNFYHERYGRQHFVLPVILLILTTSCLLIWSQLSVQAWIDTGNFDTFLPHHLPLFCVVSIAGAYAYGLSDQIQRCHTWNLSPVNVYWVSFRLALAVPLAWALSYLLAGNLAIPAAFLIGVFPTNTLIKIIRRYTSQRLGFEEDPRAGDNDLKNLPALDQSKAEQFQDEGITTIPQLAYYDPVKLTMQTNIDYDYIVDCVSQALLFVYVGKDCLEKLTRIGIRGAYEMRAILLGLEEGDSDEREQAKQKLRSIAEQIGYAPDSLENVCVEAGDDPCTVFIYETWRVREDKPPT